MSSSRQRHWRLRSGSTERTLPVSEEVSDDVEDERSIPRSFISKDGPRPRQSSSSMISTGESEGDCVKDSGTIPGFPEVENAVGT